MQPNLGFSPFPQNTSRPKHTCQPPLPPPRTNLNWVTSTRWNTWRPGNILKVRGSYLVMSSLKVLSQVLTNSEVFWLGLTKQNKGNPSFQITVFTQTKLALTLKVVILSKSNLRSLMKNLKKGIKRRILKPRQFHHPKYIFLKIWQLPKKIKRKNIIKAIRLFSNMFTRNLETRWKIQKKIRENMMRTISLRSEKV